MTLNLNHSLIQDKSVERSLFILTQRGDKKSLDSIIDSHQRLVAMIARKKIGHARTNSMDDLIQAGNEGLIRAIWKFDPEAGYRFSTYAYRWIEMTIDRLCLDHGETVSMSNEASKRLRQAKHIENRVYQETGHAPDIATVAESLGTSAVDLSYIYNAIDPLSIDGPDNEDDDFCLHELLTIARDDSPEMTETEEKNLRRAINEIAKLPEEMNGIIIDYFGFEDTPLDYDELASKYKMTTDKARHLVNSALRTIRNALTSPQMRMF